MLAHQKYVQEWIEKFKMLGLSKFPENVNNLSEKKFLSDVAKHLSSSEDCQDLGWVAAHHVLSLCYHFLRQSESSDIRNELCSLLDVCIAASSDVDVQDRARMYLSLLHTLSGKKLKEILHVPGPGLASLKCDESELQLASLVKHLKEPVLILAKKRRVPTTENASCDDTDPSTLPGDILKMHYDQLSNLMKTAVDIQCIVRRTKDCTADIQALVLYFSAPENWGTVEDAMVGHLSKEAGGNTEFSISCFPMKPFPVKVDVSAEFSIENVFHTCPLSPLDIHLSDFFQPLPIPDEYTSCKSWWYRAVFKELWDSLGKKGYVAPYVDRNPSNVLQKVEEYVIRECNGEDKDMWVLIFLPPESHLVLKIKLNNDSVFVEIRTDVVLLLAYFNEYLKNGSLVF